MFHLNKVCDFEVINDLYLKIIKNKKLERHREERSDLII